MENPPFVDVFPIQKWWDFPASYVCLPEGIFDGPSMEWFRCQCQCHQCRHQHPHLGRQGFFEIRLDLMILFWGTKKMKTKTNKGIVFFGKDLFGYTNHHFSGYLLVVLMYITYNNTTYLFGKLFSMYRHLLYTLDIKDHWNNSPFQLLIINPY